MLVQRQAVPLSLSCGPSHSVTFGSWTGRLPVLGRVDQERPEPARRSPRVFVDIDDTIKATHGYQKQGVEEGEQGVRRPVAAWGCGRRPDAGDRPSLTVMSACR